MPCYDGRADEENADNKKRLHQVTDMLCRVLTHCPDEVPHLDEDIQKWWAEHQQFDKTRRT